MAKPRRALPPPRRRFPFLPQPDLVRAQYRKSLRSYLKLARRIIEDELRPTLAAYSHFRADAARLDTHREELHAAAARAMSRLSVEAPADHLAKLARSAAKETDSFQRNQLYGAIRQHLAINAKQLLVREPDLGPSMAAFVERNVGLIKTVPERLFGGIIRVVGKAMDEGRRPEHISDLLQERYSVAESDADRIANDQCGKWYGQLNQIRQEGLGIERYRWRTMRDELVRELHQEREGEVFDWDDPPDEEDIDGHPGEPINCRCFPEPILEGLDLD